jgi:broad specificity phosphatase PhoE
MIKSDFEVKMATEILIIRHGQSIGNLKEIYIGRIDWDLSEHGFLQAEETAKALSDIKIDSVYSSSLLRAKNTALPHARLRSLEVITRDDLMEIALGSWEGMEIKDLEKTDEFLHGWRENFGTFTPPGGEKVSDAADRFYNAVLEVARENEGKTVLIAAHAAVIRAFWGKVSSIAPSDVASRVKFPLNASVSRVEYKDGKLIPISYSDVTHLEKLNDSRIAVDKDINQ